MHKIRETDRNQGTQEGNTPCNITSRSRSQGRRHEGDWREYSPPTLHKN